MDSRGIIDELIEVLQDKIVLEKDPIQLVALSQEIRSLLQYRDHLDANKVQ